MCELSDLIRSRASVERIAAHLDGLGPSERVAALPRLGRSDQRLLYQSAQDSSPLHLGFLVPDDAVAPWIRHDGTNTLPLPRRLRQFEKRFARPEDGSERLFGYNETPLRWLIGPGYFVAKPVPSGSAWSARGGVVVDYFEVPDAPVPDGWPAVAANDKAPQRFVYGGTRDFIRRVTDNVSIGAAFKGERPLDHYFTLCREPMWDG
jgi:hypothetical protein